MNRMPPTQWTPEMNAVMREHYVALGSSATAKKLGLNQHQVYRQARVLNLVNIRPAVQRGAIAAKLLELCKRPGGVKQGDCEPHCATSVSDAAERLIAAGQLFKATISYRNVRYFDTAARAQAAMGRKTVKASSTNHSGVRITAPAGGPARLPGEPVITSKTKFTYAPAPQQLLRTNTYAPG